MSRWKLSDMSPQKAKDLGYDMSPTEVLTDFELATIQAIELAFSNYRSEGVLLPLCPSSQPQNIPFSVVHIVCIFTDEGHCI